ncbi:MAG: hypothetical protein JWR07_174 [Nevskia sp.]|nr:hypothetical protein [Nevskia sp.]
MRKASKLVVTIIRPAATCCLSILLALSCPIPAKAAPADAERFTQIAGFKLVNLFSFDELAGKFGPSPVITSGDAATFDARVCYQTADRTAAVDFFHGEVNWGFKIHKPRKTDTHCPVSKRLTLEDIAVAGITLGMGRADYRKLTGKSGGKAAHYIHHEFRYVHTLTDNELEALLQRSQSNEPIAGSAESLRQWDVSITLDATFKQHHLTSFTVDRAETN